MRSSKPSIFALLISILLCLGSFDLSIAQEMGKPILHNYSPRDYMASSANYMAVQDRRGLMYFANLRGILEYDGAAWRIINLPSRSTVRSLATDSTGRVYVGAIGDFGYLNPDSVGRMKFVSLLDNASDISGSLLNNQVVVLGTEKGAYFYFSGDSSYYKWNGDTLNKYPIRGIRKGFSLFYLSGKLWISSQEYGLAQLDDGEIIVPEQSLFENKYVLEMDEFDEEHYLLLTSLHRFWLVNKNTLKAKRFNTSIDDNIHELYVSGFIVLDDGKVMVSTIRSGAILLGQDGKEMIRLNESNGLQDRLVINAFQDKQGGVWLSLSKGITYLGMSIPLALWDESSGLEGLVFSVVRFDGYLYASTAQGVFRLNGNTFERVKGLDIETLELQTVDLGNGRSVLLASTVKGLFEIKGKVGRPAVKKKSYPFMGTIASSKFHKGVIFVNDAAQRFMVMKRINGNWEQIANLDSLRGRFEQIVEEAPGVVWAIERFGNQRAIRMQLDPENNFNLINHLDYNSSSKGENYFLSAFEMNNEPVLVSNSGFHSVKNGKVASLEKANLPSSGVTSLVEDNNGSLFIGRMKGNRRWMEILNPSQEDIHTYNVDSLSLKELDNLDIWGSIFLEDSKAWIGTSEGLYCFYQKMDHKIPDLPLPVIRKVALGEDSVLFHGAASFEFGEGMLFQPEPKLSHKDNFITFYFAAPYYGAHSKTEYSYKLVGQDDEWTPWTTERKKDYTLLPPGKYEFQIRARNQFHQASGITAYRFEVAPPWWKSIWAFICYGLFAIFLVYGTVKINTQRLYLQNEHLERLVYERTNEIWEQHKEIVKKTVALKRKNEEIATQHDLLEDKNTELEDAMKKLQAAQTQLVESEKMASLGQLTAGIAHEINNPINYVKGNINPLKKDFDEIKQLFRKILQLKDKSNLEHSVKQIEDYADEIDAVYLFQEMEQLLNGIEDGANRTKQIVDGLKIFSRTEHDLFKHIDIHKGIDSTLTLLNNRLKDRISIERDYAELPLIESLPGKLNQVFMNIIVNGIQAIEDRARMEGKNLNEHIGQINIKTKAKKNCLPGKEDCLQVHITDSGTGIPEKIRNKIFDPFFTTKDVGEGTGLGLSITFGIIEKHGGRIRVESKEGEGTTFIITLPFKQEEEKKEVQ
ncbi:MAG: ATP-binding protein [Bacteroidia bacterium]|nr:ATP-binding protein [Bacteroidia bacterium]